jgi:hypothetical protein
MQERVNRLEKALMALACKKENKKGSSFFY